MNFELVFRVLLLTVLLVALIYSLLDWLARHKTKPVPLTGSPILRAEHKLEKIKVDAIFFNGSNHDDVLDFLSEASRYVINSMLDRFLLGDGVAEPNVYFVRWGTADGLGVNHDIEIVQEAYFDDNYDLIHWRIGALL